MKFLSLLSLLFFAFAAHAANPIGKVTAFDGDVMLSRNNVVMPISTVTDVEQFDTVITGKNSAAKVTFIDGSKMSLTEDSELLIDRYAYNPDNAKVGNAFFNIVKGGFRFTSGKLTKLAEPDVKIKLQWGTLGVRGTKVWRTMVGDECRIYVEDGNVSVDNQHGSVVLTHGEATRIPGDVAPVGVEHWNQSDIDEIKSLLYF